MSNEKTDAQSGPKGKRPGDGVIQPPTILSRLSSSLPEWLSSNLQNKSSWKLLARCWLASWLAFVIILPERSLKALGNASFLAFIASMMLPPNMPVQLFIFAISTVIIGMLLGWGIGAAAMRAALAARDQVLLKQTLLTAQQSAAGAANPDAEFMLEIFQGAFLDTRSTVVYGCFLGVAAFIFALVRAYAPKLTLMSVFGTIVADVYCSYGPLFPVGQYTLVNTLIISVSCYTAIAIVCIVLIFPETMNHSYLAGVTSVFGDARVFLELHGHILDLSSEDVRVDSDGTLQKGRGIYVKMMATMQGLAGKNTFINGEFSWGRWNGDDVKALEEPLKILMARINGFQSFVGLLDPSRIALISGSTRTIKDDMSSTSSSIDDPTTDTELIRQLLARHQHLEEKHNLRISDVLPVVKAATADLRLASAEALDAARALLEEINTFRWKRASATFAAAGTRLEEAVDGLRASLSEFKTTSRLTILHPFLPVLRSLTQDQRKKRGVPIRSLTISSVYVAHTILSADAVLAAVQLILSTSHKRTKSRLWAPTGLRALGKAVLRRDAGGGPDGSLGEEKPIKADEEEVKEELSYRRDPDSRPPTNVIQRVMNGIHGLYRWSRTPEAIFTIKYVVVTIALWIPSVLKSTAYFAYVQKGVWALIMAQTTLNIYVADQIYNYVARILGTVLGLVIGTAVWYIGNGSGPGNAFGSAATVAVVLVPVMFFRIFAPPSQLVPMVMFSVTMALIVGYSWIDGHLFTVGNPGVGWNVAWKRFVLVIVGCAASFVLMFIPPTSGRKAVRMRNALIITELSNLYAFLMSTWLAQSSNADASQNNTPDAQNLKPAWLKEYRVRLLSIAEQIQTLRAQTAIAKWEGNIRGAWPEAEYSKLADREWDMLVALAQLGGALIHLDPVWKGTFNQRTRVLNPNFFTDVMSTFTLVSQSLRTGEPIHQVIPTSLLDRLLYHQQHQVNSNNSAYEEAVDYVERVQSLEFVFFATGVAAMSQIISCLDELHKTTKVLCGEIPFKGFESWKGDHDRVYSVV